MVSFRTLTLTVSAALLSSAAGQLDSVTGRVYPVGADYDFELGIHSFKCQVVPIDGSPSFFTGCTRQQANEFADGQPVTLELGPRSETGDPFRQQLEASFGIVHPPTEIRKSSGRRSARKRRVVPDGPRSILAILVNYTDDTPDYVTESEVATLLSNPIGSYDVDRMFRNTSYDRISTPASETRVITVTVPHPVSYHSGCPWLLIGGNASAQIASQHPGLNPNNYAHKVYYIPRDISGCGWAGLAYVGTCYSGTSSFCASWMRTDSGGTLGHELGHNLGVSHAADDYNDDGTQGAEYGDSGDFMGGSGWKTMNAPHRVTLGYLGIGNGVQSIAAGCPGVGTPPTIVNISRLDLSPSGNPNPNALMIPRHAQGSEGANDYFISYLSTADWGLASSSYKGKVQVHYHNGDRFTNSKVVAKLDVGQTYTQGETRDGSASGGTLGISVLSKDDDYATVMVDQDCATPSPTQTGQTFAPTTSPTQSVNYRGNMSCGETLNDDTTGFANILGNTAPDHYYTFSLPADAEVTLDTCGSAYDTWIRVYDETFTTQIYSCDDCGPCGTRTIATVNLQAGNYVVVVEGWSNREGVYTMDVNCVFQTTQSPVTTRPTVSPTTLLPTGSPATTEPTTSEPTTSEPTTSLPTMSPATSEPTSSVPSTAPSSTLPSTSPTTSEPTTSRPSSSPTTSEPTTSEPTTSQPSLSPTTSEPTSSQPTLSPTTSEPTTSEPTTSEPTTSMPSVSPSSSPPTTSEPTATVPTTPEPTSSSPTASPSTSEPTTSAPSTSPVTSEPTTSEPTSSIPTASPATSEPTSSMPTTSPATSEPTSSLPTASPATSEPTFSSPTASPATSEPTSSLPTASPATSEPTSSIPTTSPATSEPTSSIPTASPATSEPTSSLPTASPATSEPTSSMPTTSEPTSSVPTSTPTTSEPTTSSCFDSHASCPLWASLGYCKSRKHNDFMHSSCARSCVKCEDNFLEEPPLNPPSCHMAAAGKASSSASNPTRCAPNSELLAVRCCSDTDRNHDIYTGWAQYAGCPWTESDDMAAGYEMCMTLSYEDAKNHCENASARLCTLAEIESDCTINTGCSFNSRTIWSSTPPGALLASNLDVGMDLTVGEVPTEDAAVTTDSSPITPNGHSYFASNSNSDDETASSAAVVGAVLGVLLLLLLIIGAVVISRGQRVSSLIAAQTKEQPEKDDIFQLATDGSVRLVSRHRANPLGELQPVDVSSVDYDTLDSGPPPGIGTALEDEPDDV